MRAAFSGLTPAHQRILRLRTVEGLTWRAIAERTGIDDAGAQRMHARAVARLRTSLALMGVERLEDFA